MSCEESNRQMEEAYSHWKSLMEEKESVENAFTSRSSESPLDVREEGFERLQTLLAACDKAEQRYMETRWAFIRAKSDHKDPE